MNHEINDNLNKQTAESTASESLFLKVHESDKVANPTEDIARQIEKTEAAIKAQMERIASIAVRALGLANCSEPHHFEMIKDLAKRGADNNEPAYKALHAHLT
jgi:hypothetical protein